MYKYFYSAVLNIKERKTKVFGVVSLNTDEYNQLNTQVITTKILENNGAEYIYQILAFNKI